MSFSMKWAKIPNPDTGNLHCNNCNNQDMTLEPEIRNQHCNNCNNQNDDAESIFAINAIENPGTWKQPESIFEIIAIENPGIWKRMGTPAREFLDLAQQQTVILYADKNNSLWWESPKYRDDPGSIDFLENLWIEAVDDLHSLSNAGCLDAILGGDRHAV
jgi:hypothetical protein